MNKFINWIIGIILLIMCVMNCILVRDLEEKTIELIELTNIEPELIFIDSLVYETIYIERYDTISLTKCQFDTITLNDTTIIIDSADVVIPIELKHYNDTLSQTAISFDLRGFQCELKDLCVRNLIVCPEQQKAPKTKDFGLGLSLGIGATKDGFSPYIGIGLLYNIFQF